MQFLFLIVLGATAATVTQGQLSIPPRELGFVYGNGQADAKVKLVAYIDLTCPDSKTAFPTLLNVADHYQPSEVQLTIKQFTLPYHRNSFLLSKAAHFLNAYNSSNRATVYTWIRAAFDNIDSLSSSATEDKTDIDVLNFVASLAYNVTGISTDQFKAGVSDVSDIRAVAKLEFLYGCTRSLSGTPRFTLNDVFVNAEPTWTATKWEDTIDNLLGAQ